MPFLLARIGTLLANPALLGAVVAGFVILAMGLALHFQGNRLASANRTIGQLQGTIQNQNAQVDAWKAAGDRAGRTARATLAEAKKQKAADEKHMTSILNRPIPADPTIACRAADALILEAIP